MGKNLVPHPASHHRAVDQHDCCVIRVAFLCHRDLSPFTLDDGVCRHSSRCSWSLPRRCTSVALSSRDSPAITSACKGNSSPHTLWRSRLALLVHSTSNFLRSPG